MVVKDPPAFKQHLGPSHFTNIHSKISVVGIVLLIVTLFLPTVFKKKREIFKLHPWAGRLSLLSAASALTLGFIYLNGLI